MGIAPCRPLNMPIAHTLLQALVFLSLTSAHAVGNIPHVPHGDAEHVTAILGGNIVLNCPVDFPQNRPVPYVIKWIKWKNGNQIPIYIWYDGYKPHEAEGYTGRLFRVTQPTHYGLASLNITDVRIIDQGWYECKVFFLNRVPVDNDNGTWVHLDVHAPPRFLSTPEPIIYVNLGDSIILNCEAEGTPEPRIAWYKENEPIRVSKTVGILNDGMELRISAIKETEIGDYICIARNGEGHIHHATKVAIAGGAVIITSPYNITKIEGDKAEFKCEARGHPSNITHMWYKGDTPIKQLDMMDNRREIKKDGTLQVHPLTSDDSGWYSCEVTNGIGKSQTASAFLNVEFPARVKYTPTVQYLPYGMQGIIQCPVEANPPLKFVSWTKDRRMFKPKLVKGVVELSNGSLVVQKVTQDHQGGYRCTPYNEVGTVGVSGVMEVLVRAPPQFKTDSRPQTMYQRRVGDELTIPCEASGQPKPKVTWRRHDGKPLPRGRFVMSEGNLTLKNLRQEDFGYYECVVSNEIATIVSSTQLVVEGTVPHAPKNVSGMASEYSVTISWLPGYSGGPGEDYTQQYVIWYRELGSEEWEKMDVEAGKISATVYKLMPNTTYQFQVVGSNRLGDGMVSKIILVTTKEVDYSIVVFPTDPSGATYLPPVTKSKGPKPKPPRNVTIGEESYGIVIRWLPPEHTPGMSIAYYTIDYKSDYSKHAQWKALTPAPIEQLQFSARNFKGGRSYYFRVKAHTTSSFSASNEVKFFISLKFRNRAITAGIVGGVLFFIVAIILSVCAVKICNKRRQRRQERAYNMVACRVTEARNGRPHSSPVPFKKKKDMEEDAYEV